LLLLPTLAIAAPVQTQTPFTMTAKPAAGWGPPNVKVRGAVVSQPVGSDGAACEQYGWCYFSIRITEVLLTPDRSFYVGKTVGVSTNVQYSCVDSPIRQGDNLEVAGYGDNNGIDAYECENGHYVRKTIIVCSEGAVKVLERCPDGSTWTHMQVCRNNAWVDEYKTCPPVCSEGAIRNVVMCPDGVNWKQREVCRNNAWVPEQQTCPLCSEGDVRNEVKCPDGVNWTKREVCRNNNWVPESKTCELPSIEYELPVKTDLSVEILRGERPWLDTLYDSNLFFEADERFWDYANNAMDQPARFMNERYRFGNLDTWLAVSNKGAVSITIDYVTVHLNPQKMHKHVSGASDIYDDNWIYSYSLDLPLKRVLAPGEKTKLTLSTIPLYLADPYPYMSIGSANMMHTQTYVVHFTIHYRSSLGNQLTLDTTEFPVLAKSTIDQVFWDFVESVFTSALAAARGEAKITAQIVVDIIDDVIESLTKIFLSSDSNIVGLLDTQGKLGLRVYDMDGKQIILSADNMAVLEGATIARLPQELTDFRVDIDAAQARYAKENFEIKVVTVRRGLCIETTSVSGSIEQGDVQTKPIYVSPDGKSIEVKSTDAYQPQLSLDRYQSWLAYGVLAAVAVSIIIVYATRRRDRPSRQAGPRVKEIYSTIGKPRVKSIQETGTKPRVLKIEED